MAKKQDFVTAFVWACNVLDTQDLSIAEQAVLFNLLKLINRNFWKPVKISPYKLARNMCSDVRTVNKALNSLAKKQIIFNQEGEIFIATITEEQFQSLVSKSNGGAVSKQNESVEHNQPADNTTANRADSAGNADQAADQPKTLADF